MKTRPWYTSSRYKHLDVPIGESFAVKTANPSFVAGHAWTPLIRYTKRIKRYRSKDKKTAYKDRVIMYASHRDACILKRYAHDLTQRLENYYTENGLNETVAAYRKLGKANYHFAAEAFHFAKEHLPCKVLCFDVTGFFDNLNHSILKDRLKRILGTQELSSDWHAVFRNVTRFRSIERSDIEAHSLLGPKLLDPSQRLIAPIAEIKAAGIHVAQNLNSVGIPQGTPISSVFSNLYLVDFDKAILSACAKYNAFYRRYSDDILIICPLGVESILSTILEEALAQHCLSLASDKSQEETFDSSSTSMFQYLGFNIGPDGPVVRPSSLARQWRKAKRSLERVRRIGLAAIASGRSDKIYVRQLRKRFSPVGAKNFSSYARRSGQIFGTRKITRQVTRLERKIDAEIRALQGLSKSPSVIDP